MEGIKKKLASIRSEADEAVDRAEKAEQAKKEAQTKADEVTTIDVHRGYIYTLSRAVDSHRELNASRFCACLYLWTGGW